jgi:ribosomal protein S18 acetylase RimI-like enzyme
VIRELERRDADACDAIVAGLPEWFGDEVGIADCAAAVRSQEGLAAEQDGEVVGFLTFQVGAGPEEITWMAVRSDKRRNGVGRALVEQLVERLVDAGSRVLWVKTLSDRDGPFAPYEETRQFYLNLGFVRGAELDIWGPDNPAVAFELSLD